MKATIHLMPTSLRRQFAFLNEQQVPLILSCFRVGLYHERHEVCDFFPNGDEQDYAEEMFDLTNNPSRQEQRELLYGNHRSVSVGDIVEVEHRDNPEKVSYFLCASIGWEDVTGTLATLTA